MNNNNDFFNFNLNNWSKNTPIQNNSNSRIGTPINFSSERFPNSILLESNGKIELNEISDENLLNNKFEAQEESIKNYCSYYKSLKSIFNSVNNNIKNKLLQYVTEFNDSCKKFSDIKCKNIVQAKKSSEVKNKLQENLDQKIEELNNIKEKYRIEKEDLIEKYKKDTNEYKNKLRNKEDEIRKYKATIEDLEKSLNQYKKKFTIFREENSKNQSNSLVYTNISYALGEKTDDAINIKIDGPKKKDFDTFSEKFKKSQDNFNKYAKQLVDISNKTFEKYKAIYYKIKGEEWFDSNNSLIKKHDYQTYNINEDFSWTNITNIHLNIDAIIEKIFEIVNPTCDPKKLNEDSCEFLLNYIIGLKKLFFVQKEILDNSFNNGNNFEEKNKNWENFKKVNEEAKKFFAENNSILENQSYFDRFKNELKEENTKILSVDEYIKNIKTVLVQAKNISEKKENEYKEYIKNLNSQNNRTTTEDIEMELSNSKNKRFNKNINNGI